jgi:hypothetical protein
MNASKLFAVTALAALTSFGAYAGEADYNEHNAQQFTSVRSAQEVRAEAAQVAKNRSTEPAGSRVSARVTSSLDRAAVRAETVAAVRAGQIPAGELSL